MVECFHKVRLGYEKRTIKYSQTQFDICINNQSSYLTKITTNDSLPNMQGRFGEEKLTRGKPIHGKIKMI